MHTRMLWFLEKLQLQGYCSIYSMFYLVDFLVTYGETTYSEKNLYCCEFYNMS
jgi:hypothetical protein